MNLLRTENNYMCGLCMGLLTLRPVCIFGWWERQPHAVSLSAPVGSWGARQDRVCVSSLNLPGEVLAHYQLFIKPSTAHQRDQRTRFFMNVSFLCSAALLELTWHTASHAYSILWTQWYDTFTARLLLAASVETFAAPLNVTSVTRFQWGFFLCV